LEDYKLEPLDEMGRRAPSMGCFYDRAGGRDKELSGSKKPKLKDRQWLGYGGY